MSEPNPFRTPQPDSHPDRDQPIQHHRVVDFGEIISRWEKLRWFYNGVLVVFVLVATFFGFQSLFLDPGYWICIVFGGFVANLCFLTGPAIEGYARFYWRWHIFLTYLLFLSGLGFTGILATACIVNFEQIFN